MRGGRCSSCRSRQPRPNSWPAGNGRHAAGEFLKFEGPNGAAWWRRDAQGSLWQTQWVSGGEVNGVAGGLLRPVGRVTALGGMSPAEAARGPGRCHLSPTWPA